MTVKFKILMAALAIAASSTFAHHHGNRLSNEEWKKDSEEWKAYKECKQRAEQGSDEDCYALKPVKKDGKKDVKKDGKKCDKNK